MFGGSDHAGAAAPDLRADAAAPSRARWRRPRPRAAAAPAPAAAAAEPAPSRRAGPEQTIIRRTAGRSDADRKPDRADAGPRCGARNARQPACSAAADEVTGSIKQPLNIAAAAVGPRRAAHGRQDHSGHARRTRAARRRRQWRSVGRIRDRRALCRRARRAGQHGSRAPVARARRQAGPCARAVPARQPLREGPGGQEGPRQGAPALSAGRRQRATPRRSTISRCSMPKASTASPITAPPRNGSARPPIAASPTASTISASFTRAASASTRTSPNPTSGSRSPPSRATRMRPRSARTWRARLDQQSLVAAKLAVQTFAADPPPDDAMNPKTPPGGWDRATSADACEAGCDHPPQADLDLAPEPGRPGFIMAGMRRRHGEIHACGRKLAGPFTEPSAALHVSVCATAGETD